MVRAISNNSGSSPRFERVFTRVEAAATLPLVRRIVSDLVSLNQSISTQRAQIREIDRMTATIPLADYRDELGDIRSSLRNDEASFEKCMAELISLGVIPHDPIDGGVDFPGVLNRRNVRYCWLPGEPTIEFWHEIDEPCANRQTIDE
jgi:hypothetical protein